MGFLQGVTIDGQLIIWLAIGILLVFGIMVVNSRMRRVAVFGGRAILGAIGIAAINLALGGLGLALGVGVNLMTVAVVAFLGLPGIVMLYGLTFIL